MIHWRLGTLALLAGLGFCVGCSNMGNGQMMCRLTGRNPCPCPCPECDCPCTYAGVAGYGAVVEAPGVLVSAGPGMGVPVQMAPTGPVLPSPLLNPAPPRLEPQPPIQQSQPMAAEPQSRIIPR